LDKAAFPRKNGILGIPYQRPAMPFLDGRVTSFRGMLSPCPLLCIILEFEWGGIGPSVGIEKPRNPTGRGVEAFGGTFAGNNIGENCHETGRRLRKGKSRQEKRVYAR
jgi:hypothetical protein